MIVRHWLIMAFALAAVLGSPALAQTPLEWDGDIVKQEASWYESAEARRIADSVVQHQSPEGGWPKNTSLLDPPVPPVDDRLKNTFAGTVSNTSSPASTLLRIRSRVALSCAAKTRPPVTA